MSFVRTALVTGAALGVFFLASRVAEAQSTDLEFKPKNFAVVDAQGVDVANRTFNAGHTITIGDPNDGGMSYSVTQSSPGGWRIHHSALAFARLDVATDPDTGSVTETWTLRFQGKTELMQYTGVGSQYLGDLGSRLSLCGSWCASAVLSDGTVLAIDSVPYLVSQTVTTNSYVLRVVSAVKPNGERLDYHYIPGEFGIRSVTNNRGYQLRFEQPSAPGSGGMLRNVTSIVLFNMAVDPCDPVAAACPTFSRTWPRLSFENLANAFAVTETDGSRTVYTYATGNAPTRITHIDAPGTRDIDVTYQDCGPLPPFGQCSTGGEIVGGFRVQSVAKGGRTWNYQWEPGLVTNNNPQHGVRVTSAVGYVSYTTDVTVAAGNAFGDLYGMAARIVRISDELGRITKVEYFGTLNPQASKITYPEGNGEEYTYDQRANVQQIRRFAKLGTGLSDQLIQITRGESGTTTQCSQPGYCNKPVIVRDARGFVTRHAWNVTTGLLLSSEAGLQGANGSLTCSFGANACPKTTFAYTGVSAYFYNAAGQLAAGPAIFKPTSKTQCEAATTCASSAEIVTTMNYGAAGVGNNLLLKSLSVGKGGQSFTTMFSYNEVGDRSQVNGPRTDVADVLNFSWDSSRRPIDEIAADGSGVRRSYSSEGYVAAVARGVFSGSTFTAYETVSNTYDGSGNLIRATSPVSVTQYSYDGVNRRTCTATRMNPSVYGSLPADACVLSPQGLAGPDRIARNVYDAAGEVTTIQRAYATGVQQNYATYAYTLNGQQDWVEDANGNRTDLSYDGFDRLVQQNFPHTTPASHAANPNDYEQYGYDANNNRTSLRLRSTETIGYSYDALNREAVRDLPSGSDIYLSYDLLGRQLSATYGSGGQGVLYSYDGWGRVLTEATFGRTLSYLYDAAGNRTRLTWPDGQFVEYTYDLMNRMDLVRENGATSGAGVLADYSYDVLGRRTMLVRGNGSVTGYGYDGISRLSSLTQNLTGAAQDLSLGFTHNAANQIVTRTLSNDTYGYSPGTVVNRPYVPDGLNRYSSVDGTSFSYDARGNLINNGVRTFTYDALNHLTAVTGSGGTPTLLSLSYDPLGRLHQTVAISTTQFLNAGDQLVAEFDGASATPARRYVHGASSDEPLVWYEGATMSATTRRWLHSNHQGSVIGATDATGALVGSAYSYSSYGEPNKWAGSRFRYTGQTVLPEVQLYHYKARVYDPALGRFLQTDPVGYQDDVNLYAYVGNDPLNGTDPTGEDCVDPRTGPCETVTVTAPRFPPPAVAGAAVAVWASEAVATGSGAGALPFATVGAGVVGAIYPISTASDDTCTPIARCNGMSSKSEDKSKPKSGEGKKAYAQDKKFRRWFHKEYKPSVKSGSKDVHNPDIDLEEGYQQWLGEGKPSAGE